MLNIARCACRGVKSGNQQFARDVTAWTFQESHVLRIDQVEHHRVNETLPQETYTTNDQVVSILFIIVPSQHINSFAPTCRPSRRTSRSTTPRPTSGNLTLASRTCNLSSRCSTRIFARRFPPSPANPANIRSRSVFPTGTACSSSSSTTSAKGTPTCQHVPSTYSSSAPIQIVVPLELDRCPSRAPAARRLPAFPQCRLAILCRRIQHKCRICVVRRALALR